MIRQAEYLREPYLLLETLKSFANNELTIKDLNVVDALGEPLVQSSPLGLCLTDKVESSLNHDRKSPS